MEDSGSQIPASVDAGLAPDEGTEAGSPCFAKTTGIGGCTDATDASTSYACPSGVLPPSNPSTTCSYLGEDPPGLLYCCTLGSCTPTEAFVGCNVPGAMPFECADGAAPDETNPAVWCMPGSPGNTGRSQFCCYRSTCTNYGAGVASCPPEDTLFRCSGSAVPSQLDPTLGCVVQPGGATASTSYCCHGG